MDRLYQQGCAKILIPNTRDMEAVIINTSGGMTGGDRLDWRFESGARTELTVTSQACERVYAASGGVAQTKVELVLEAGSRLAWLPQETILFDQGALQRTVTVRMADDAQLLMVEPVILGRQAMGEVVQAGNLQDRWRIHKGNRLLHAEDFRLQGRIDKILADQAATGGATAAATLLLISPRGEGLLEEARAIIGTQGGASFWNGKLLARLVAKDSYTLRKTLVPLIKLLNHRATLPKVWSS